MSKSANTKVTFSVEHTTRDGKTHQPDSTASLSPAEARYVLLIGHARPSDASTPATSATTKKEEVR